MARRRGLVRTGFNCIHSNAIEGRHTGKVTRVTDDNSAAGLELIESGRHDEWVDMENQDIN